MNGWGARVVSEKDRIVGLLKDAGVTVNGPNPWDIQVHNERMWTRLFSEGSLGLGESYIDGEWDIWCVTCDREIPTLPGRDSLFIPGKP